jgi:Flp pilus assembly protein TadG
MTRLLRRLLAARDGSTIVELGLLAPLMCALLLGVLQVGIGMHSYNALRGISSDVARYAIVQYQTDNELGNSQLTDYARSVAISPPYGLQDSDVQVSVLNATTQRVAGAKELTFTITYTIDSFLGVIGLQDFSISFTRPIFVLDD